MFRVLLENGVITFAGALTGGVLLGPAGIAIGGGAASGLHLLGSGGLSTWDQLRAANSWRGIIMLTLRVAATLAIENSSLLYDLALSIARFLGNLFNSHHNHAVSQ